MQYIVISIQIMHRTSSAAHDKSSLFSELISFSSGTAIASTVGHLLQCNDNTKNIIHPSTL